MTINSLPLLPGKKHDSGAYTMDKKQLGKSSPAFTLYFKPIVSMYLKEGDGIKLESGFACKTFIIFLTILTLGLSSLPAFLINIL